MKINEKNKKLLDNFWEKFFYKEILLIHLPEDQ